MVQMLKYCTPICTMVSSAVNALKKGVAKNSPNSANTTELATHKNTPFVAALLASSNRFSPNLLDNSELMPTPVPTDTATISICTGNASDTAASALSPTCATNMLSTTLYRACTNMEIIIGKDTLINNFPTGITPILFSFLVSIVRFSSIPLPPFCVRHSLRLNKSLPVFRIGKQTERIFLHILRCFIIVYCSRPTFNKYI